MTTAADKTSKKEESENDHSEDEALQDFREQYQKYSDTLQAANTKTQEELDKSLITLSTVLIGVVLTLRQQIFSTTPSFGFPTVMWIAIVLLILCILSVLVSHFLSLWVSQRLIDAIDNFLKSDDSSAVDSEVQKAHARSSFVRLSNYASAALFFAGLVAAVVFAVHGSNLKGSP